MDATVPTVSLRPQVLGPIWTTTCRNPVSVDPGVSFCRLRDPLKHSPSLRPVRLSRAGLSRRRLVFLHTHNRTLTCRAPHVVQYVHVHLNFTYYGTCPCRRIRHARRSRFTFTPRGTSPSQFLKSCHYHLVICFTS